ncbi:MAG: hypothetical protein RLZ10_1383 [Bacteroidota bacterium]|jgi:hypothetical protein
MDINIYYTQYDRLKTGIVLDITQELEKIGKRVDFYEIMYFVDPKDSDRIYQIRGLENGYALIDSAYVGFEAIELSQLSIDCLLFIKQQIEYHKNEKFISNSL